MNEHELRIGDAERESAARALGEHYAAGRLSKEEYDERSERAWGAKTNADLWPLFVDLPTLSPPQRRSPAPAPATRSAGGQDDRPWRAWGLPFWPVVLVLVLLGLVTRTPFLVLLLVAWLFLAGPLRRGRNHRHHRHH